MMKDFMRVHLMKDPTLYDQQWYHKIITMNAGKVISRIYSIISSFDVITSFVFLLRIKISEFT